MFALLALFLSPLSASDLQASEGKDEGLPEATIKKTVREISAVLIENYVYPETATEMQSFLQRQLLDGAYSDSRSQRELIDAIQSDLIQVSKDGHIGLLLAADSVDRTSTVRPINASRDTIHVEVLSSNGTSIGYMAINTFSGDPTTKGHLIGAMERVASTDALVIDLRENGGGDPNFVALLSSYFLENDTSLWSIVDRQGKPVLEVRSKARQNKYEGELIILTSVKTYSAAEAFAYTLKHLDRAVIVGEATGGGAHLIDMIRVSDTIDMRVPVVRAYNHITESNWEGVGVIPDIEVRASEAKSIAIELLSENAIKNRTK